MSDTTPSPKPAKPDVRFLVTISDSRHPGDRQYRHFRAEAYVLGVDRYGSTGRPELLTPGGYGIPGDRASALAGLVITAQSDSDHMKQPGDEWYGPEVSYDRFNGIKLADAEEILPVLRKIRKCQDKLTSEFGYPATLAQFCIYAARAVTSAHRPFLHRVSDDRDIEGTGCRSMDGTALSYHLQADAQAWRKEHHAGLAG